MKLRGKIHSRCWVSLRLPASLQRDYVFHFSWCLWFNNCSGYISVKYPIGWINYRSIYCVAWTKTPRFKCQSIYPTEASLRTTLTIFYPVHCIYSMPFLGVERKLLHPSHVDEFLQKHYVTWKLSFSQVPTEEFRNTVVMRPNSPSVPTSMQKCSDCFPIFSNVIAYI